MQLLDLLLEHLKARKLLKARGQQRTDSTHIIAAVRSLHRLECVGETLRAALNALATSLSLSMKLSPPNRHYRISI